MKRKIFLMVIITILSVNAASAQNQSDTDTLTRELQEVIVNAKQPATRLIGSTLVSTIPGSNLADLGNALDVLAQLPMITVQDNTIGVIGRSDVEIFIDGRPMRNEFEIGKILSSDLKKVELVLAPGATHESTSGAVLKIYTKRNLVKGLSVSDQFRIQRRRKWSVMNNTSLSYRIENWELFADGSVNRNNSVVKGTTENTLIFNGKPTIVSGTQNNSFPTATGVVRAGINYNKGALSFGGCYTLNPESGDFRNSGTEKLDNNPGISREIKKSIKAQSHLASFYLENVFDSRYLLHFDGDYKHSAEHTQTSATYPDSDNPEVNSKDYRTSSLLAGKLYLNFPLWQGDFTAGIQDSYTRTSLDYRMLNPQVEIYIPSSQSVARQISAGLFASWSRMFGNLSLTAGARYEYIDYDFTIDGKRDGDVCRRDHLLTPDISLGYSFNDECTLNLSYKLATVRPPYSQITGSLNYVGLHEIEGGNPALRDEKRHDLQVFGMWRSLILQGGFTRSIDTYAYVKQLYPSDNLQLLMHPVNVDVSALSLFLVWSQPVKCWTPNLTIGVYRQWLSIDGTSYDKPIFSYYFDNTFSFPKGWLITANISGRTSGYMHTNRFGATRFTMDASIGKTFFDKSLTVKISATDIFNNANNNWTMETYGITVDKRQSYDNRGISLNIIYNFQPQKSRYKGAAASSAELDRL